MKLSSEWLRHQADGWEADSEEYTATVYRTCADLLDATTPRPWPPPAGVERCLGWDKRQEKWRVCIFEYRNWVFEDTSGFAQGWCSLWLPIPADPKEDQ